MNHYRLNEKELTFKSDMRQLKITKSITDRSTKAVEKYLTDIAKIELITQEREIELAKLIKDGDQAALEELVHANLRFVVSVSKQYQNRGVSLPDLISEGNIGLIKAARKFDETRGFKFISFAVWWVRQAILESIAQSGRLIRIPLNKIGLQNKFLTAYSKLEQRLERQPTDSEVMEEMGVDEKEIKDLSFVLNKVQSYDVPISEDDGAGTLLDLLTHSNKEHSSPDKPLMNESLQEDISRAVATLTDREQQVIKMFFGMGYSQEYTLDEIGMKLELTRERARQIKEKAVRRLRTHGRSTLLRKYLN